MAYTMNFNDKLRQMNMECQVFKAIHGVVVDPAKTKKVMFADKLIRKQVENTLTEIDEDELDAAYDPATGKLKEGYVIYSGKVERSSNAIFLKKDVFGLGEIADVGLVRANVTDIQFLVYNGLSFAVDQNQVLDEIYKNEPGIKQSTEMMSVVRDSLQAAQVHAFANGGTIHVNPTGQISDDSKKSYAEAKKLYDLMEKLIEVNNSVQQSKRQRKLMKGVLEDAFKVMDGDDPVNVKTEKIMQRMDKAVRQEYKQRTSVAATVKQKIERKTSGKKRKVRKMPLSERFSKIEGYKAYRDNNFESKLLELIVVLPAKNAPYTKDDVLLKMGVDANVNGGVQEAGVNLEALTKYANMLLTPSFVHGDDRYKIAKGIEGNRYIEECQNKIDEKLEISKLLKHIGQISKTDKEAAKELAGRLNAILSETTLSLENKAKSDELKGILQRNDQHTFISDGEDCPRIADKIIEAASAQIKSIEKLVKSKDVSDNNIVTQKGNLMQVVGMIEAVKDTLRNEMKGKGLVGVDGKLDADTLSGMDKKSLKGCGFFDSVISEQRFDELIQTLRTIDEVSGIIVVYANKYKEDHNGKELFDGDSLYRHSQDLLNSQTKTVAAINYYPAAYLLNHKYQDADQKHEEIAKQQASAMTKLMSDAQRAVTISKITSPVKEHATHALQNAVKFFKTTHSKATHKNFNTLSGQFSAFKNQINAIDNADKAKAAERRLDELYSKYGELERGLTRSEQSQCLKMLEELQQKLREKVHPFTPTRQI